MTRNVEGCKHDDKNDRLREVMMTVVMTRKVHKGNNNNDNDRLREVLVTVIMSRPRKRAKRCIAPKR